MKCKINSLDRLLPLGVLVVLFCWLAAPAKAQLPSDVREVFEELIEEMDDDLRVKFERAIADDTTRIEFTPEEFLRFRAIPDNPFEGLDEVRAWSGGPNIVLRFELPSLRDRVPGRLERQSYRVLRQLSGPASTLAGSVATIEYDGRAVALAAVVDASGLLVTKASEVTDRPELSCRFAGGRRLSVEILAVDETHDVALLQVDARGLTPIEWSQAEPELGEFLLTPRPDGSVIAMGTYSVRPRSTTEGERAYLGVQPITTAQGVQVNDIRPGAASFAAGLRDGDVILRLGEIQITDVASLVKSIRDMRPGDEVTIEYQRNGQVRTTVAVLGGNRVSSERAARFKMMNRLGAIPSQRDGNFPNVFQHDTPLFPEQCGGPLVDLEGRVVGLNIARRGRAATFAIPADTMRRVVAELRARANQG